MRYSEIVGTSKIKENASTGATGAPSIATAIGGLGNGFDPNGDHGIYEVTKKPVLIKRIPNSEKK